MKIKILFIVCAMVSSYAMDEQYVKNQKLGLAIIMDSVEDAEQALKNGANPNKSDLFAPLSGAIDLDPPNTEIIKLMLQYKGNANEICADGTPLLWQAAKLRNFEIAELLIDYGADVNFLSNDIVLLGRFIQNPDSDFLKLLLNKGYNVDLVYINPNRIAIISKFLILDYVFRYLTFYKAKKDSNNKAKLDYLAKWGFDIINPKKSLEVCIQELEKMAVHLISHGAGLTQKDYDHEFLKPMLKPYVEVVTNNARLFKPLARLVVEYIYNIKVDAEDKGT